MDVELCKQTNVKYMVAFNGTSVANGEKKEKNIFFLLWHAEKEQSENRFGAIPKKHRPYTARNEIYSCAGSSSGKNSSYHVVLYV